MFVHYIFTVQYHIISFVSQVFITCDFFSLVDLLDAQASAYIECFSSQDGGRWQETRQFITFRTELHCLLLQIGSGYNPPQMPHHCLSRLSQGPRGCFIMSPSTEDMSHLTRTSLSRQEFNGCCHSLMQHIKCKDKYCSSATQAPVFQLD